MATNRDLLKEAIADAKAVKETAIANAKAALEEAFTPFLKEKLASKIAEMDEVDEELELEESEVSEVEKEKVRAMEESDDVTEEISLEELLAELEEESNMEETDTMEETYMDEDLYEAEDEEEMSIEDMSEDDLKSFIEDVIKDMVEAGELEAGESMEGEEEEGGEEIEMDMDMEAGEEDGDAEINIDELLAEVEGSKDEQMEEGQVDEFDMSSILTTAGTPTNLEYIMGLITAAAVAYSTWKSSPGDPKAKAKLDKAMQDLENAKKESGTAESTSESEIKEAYATIEELRNELNEINLLNAKLLYTNKIFRNKSLTETQKVHVLTSFDKATTKKEVELVYETLTESLKVSTATKAPIKESLGSASKVLGGATSKPIIENDAFARMRELAFFGKNK